MTTPGRWTIIPAVTFAITLAACGSDDKAADTASTTASTTAATTAGTSTAGPVVITVTSGVDSGEDRVEQVPLGSTVKLTVVNPDKDDEFHVHGYDLGDGVAVKKGEPETFTFTADKAGEFEVESHTTDVVLLILKVS